MPRARFGGLSFSASLVGFMLLGAALLPVPTQAASAQLRLLKGVGPPTTHTTAEGRGYAGGEAVRILFDQTFLRSTTASSQGQFAAGIRVPASATPGAHSVTAVGSSSGQTASAGFTVRTDWVQFHFDP